MASETRHHLTDPVLVLDALLPRREVRELPDVRAGREGPATGTPQYDDPDPGITVDDLADPQQPVVHGPGDRVPALRVGQPQPKYLAVPLDQQLA